MAYLRIGAAEGRALSASLALWAFAVGWPGGVKAEPKVRRPTLRIDRIDASEPPLLRLYVTHLDANAGLVESASRRSGSQVAGYRLLVNGERLASSNATVTEATKAGGEKAEGETATAGPAMETFAERQEPLALTFVIQVSPSMSPALGAVQSRAKSLLKKLPSGSQIGVVAYADVVAKDHKPGPIKSAAPVLGQLSPREDAFEVQMPDAIRDAIEGLSLARLPPRRLMVVVSDGLTADMNFRIFSQLGRRAKEQGIRIHTIGFAPLEPERLRTLFELSKRGGGTFRPTTTVAEISAAFRALGQEVLGQKVLSYRVPDLFNGKIADFQIEYGEGLASEVAMAELVQWKDQTQGAWYRSAWFITIAAGMGLLGLTALGMLLWRLHSNRKQLLQQRLRSMATGSEETSEYEEDDEFEEEDPAAPIGSEPLTTSPHSAPTEVAGRLSGGASSTGQPSSANPGDEEGIKRRRAATCPDGSGTGGLLLGSTPNVGRPNETTTDASSVARASTGVVSTAQEKSRGGSSGPGHDADARRSAVGNLPIVSGSTGPAPPVGVSRASVAMEASSGAHQRRGVAGKDALIPGLPLPMGHLEGGQSGQRDAKQGSSSGEPPQRGGSSEADPSNPGGGNLLPKLPSPTQFLRRAKSASDNDASELKPAAPEGALETSSSGLPDLSKLAARPVDSGSHPKDGPGQPTQNQPAQNQSAQNQSAQNQSAQGHRPARSITSPPGLAPQRDPLLPADTPQQSSHDKAAGRVSGGASASHPSVPVSADAGRVAGEGRSTQVISTDDLVAATSVAWLVHVSGGTPETLPLHQGFTIGVSEGDFQVKSAPGNQQASGGPDAASETAAKATVRLAPGGVWVLHLKGQDGGEVLEDGRRFAVAGSEFIFKVADRLPAAGRRSASRLQVIGGIDDGSQLPLPDSGEVHVVGSDQSCDVVLRGEGVGPRHLAVRVTGDGCNVADLGSPTGLRVQGEVVGSTVLRPGQEVEVGKVRLLLLTAKEAGRSVETGKSIETGKSVEGTSNRSHRVA